MKQQGKNSRSDPPADLTGMRFEKWTVLKYAGQKVRYYGGQRFSTRMWLCRCDCGVEKQVQHYNLTEGLSTQCQECRRNRHGMSSTRIYEQWTRLKQRGELSKDWQDFDVFIEAVGDPPNKEAYLTRYDRTKPYSPGNAFWLYPALLQDDPTFLKRIRKQSREERVTHDTMLMRIRNAKSRDERDRCMVAARKAGHSFELIGMAAKLTRQRAHIIVTR